MSPVTGGKPSHDVITVDNKSSNTSSHTFVSRMFRSMNSADQELAILVLPRKLTPQVFEFSFLVLDISSSLKLDTFLNIGTHPSAFTYIPFTVCSGITGYRNMVKKKLVVL